MNPWMRLRTYPAWRGLENALADLASLLSQAGPGDGAAHELAGQIELLLSDPEAAAGRRPAHARVRSAKAGPDTEFEPDLTALAVDLIDTAVFLEVPHAALHLGHRLVSGLPRQWQGRISSWTLHLRQVMLSSRRGAGARPAPRAILPDLAPETPISELPEGWAPTFAIAGDGQFVLVLPQEATPTEIQSSHVELLYLVLMEYGLDAAKLHLHLLTEATGTISHADAAGVLGLRRQGAAQRERSRKALEHLQTARLTVYRWRPDGEALEYERNSGPLWDLQVSFFGQARLLEQGGTLTARGEEWSVRVRPGAGLPALLPAPSPGALCPPLSDLNPLAACTAILLAFGGRSGAAEVSLPHDLLFRAARLDGPDDLRRQLKAAARAQPGWVAEVTETCTRYTAAQK